MALDFQIVLLPRNDYWLWLQACRAYVVKFGANLTPEPDVAARYMAPRQVVTLVVFDGAYPDLGDPLDWFRRNHDGVRLDTIEADTPQQLKKILHRRVADNDRYGAKRRPFHLLWPTDYPVLTQAFGANPQIYRRYGMPGHEGVDLRALTNTNVYASADGEVYEVHTNPKDHPYGIHVRIRHADGYRTVYAHLARALTAVGDPVHAGQLIGRADSTGNSSAAHLHLTLKRDGATARQETTYPKDIIDPTPFLVWPAPTLGKSIDAVKHGPRLGLHLVRSAGLSAEDVKASATAQADAVMVGHLEPRETIDKLRAVRPSLRILARIGESPSEDASQPGRFVERVAGEVGRLYRAGVRDFELASYANEHGGGLGPMWRDGQEFAEWFCQVVSRLRLDFPDARFGFPSLAKGGEVTGRQQAAQDFARQAEDAVRQADWLAVACAPDRHESLLVDYLRNYPDKPIVVTELADDSETVSPESLALRTVALARSLRETSVEVMLVRARRASKSESASYSWEALKILADAGRPDLGVSTNH